MRVHSLGAVAAHGSKSWWLAAFVMVIVDLHGAKPVWIVLLRPGEGLPGARRHLQHEPTSFSHLVLCGGLALHSDDFQVAQFRTLSQCGVPGTH